jgi:hypothetical protein
MVFSGVCDRFKTGGYELFRIGDRQKETHGCQAINAFSSPQQVLGCQRPLPSRKKPDFSRSKPEFAFSGLNDRNQLGYGFTMTRDHYFLAFGNLVKDLGKLGLASKVLYVAGLRSGTHPVSPLILYRLPFCTLAKQS